MLPLPPLLLPSEAVARLLLPLLPLLLLLPTMTLLRLQRSHP